MTTSSHWATQGAHGARAAKQWRDHIRPQKNKKNEPKRAKNDVKLWNVAQHGVFQKRGFRVRLFPLWENRSDA
jgi:hypothetical protein